MSELTVRISEESNKVLFDLCVELGLTLPEAIKWSICLLQFYAEALKENRQLRFVKRDDATSVHVVELPIELATGQVRRHKK